MLSIRLHFKCFIIHLKNCHDMKSKFSRLQVNSYTNRIKRQYILKVHLNQLYTSQINFVSQKQNASFKKKYPEGPAYNEFRCNKENGGLGLVYHECLKVYHLDDHLSFFFLFSHIYRQK